ncbi:Nucleoside-diphosphate-sugar epimerase [Amycolatopsis xylanica]|uniref:Nucleoside-diphosphate-sugar epimerase n=1 Tax=Amycolatopsis xylanica TaxID=589385 RepID=A0A1H3SB51_9PSEU|nr:NAD-dependent epimerase/dehydratase family protein [Amycolatopsis xylanica]SDZ34349.1 Nucleoside-diphosphate-sugar epimerase [Amycolatopsis xylanica]
MKVVITGLTGNIGTAFLRRYGADPALDLTGIARRVPPREDHGKVRWVACDVGSPEAPRVLAEAFEGADAVVHLAWSIHPPAGEPPMARTNETGTAQVLAAAADAGVGHVVCASSVAAYGKAPRWTKVAEDWPRTGIDTSAYSRGKALLERQLDEFADRHPAVKVTRIRPCAVVQHDAAGEFSDWLLSSLLPERLVGSRWLPLPLWPRLRAQAVHAEDVADALHTILFRKAEGAFNLASAQVLDAGALADAIGGPRIPVPRTALRAAAWVTWRGGLQPVHPGWLTLADQAPLIDTTRARDELGWRPRYDSAAAISALVAGMAERAGTASPPLAARPELGLADRIGAVRPGQPSHQSQA